MKKVFILIIICLILVGCKKGSENRVIDNTNSNIYILINNKEYVLKLDNNESANEFKKLLPLELSMSDLNNNEKYVYLNKKLVTNEYSPKVINKGDVMLYNDNCLVIFYKSFETNYRYTKLGHIDNLDDLNNESVKVIINEKSN